MEKGFVILFFVLAMTLRLSAAAEDEAELTSVSDFSHCTKIKIKQLHVDDEVCVKIAFIKSEIGIEISITWDGKVIFNTKISVKQPPPICFQVPLVKNIKACLKLTDVSFQPHHHGACISIEIKALVFHKTFKLGCIYKETEEARNSKTPLEILNAVKTLINSYDAGKIGNEKDDWLKESDESGNNQNQKNLLDFFTSHDMKKQVDAVGKVSKTCSCHWPRQCVCCKEVALSPSYQTKVCGKVVVTQKGKGAWVFLVVDEANHFKVYTPVSRPFKFACSKVQVQNNKPVICLQLKKVEQTKKGIDLCFSAAINLRSSNHLVSLGCVTVNVEEDGKKHNDDLVKFEPIFKLIS